MTLGHMLVVAGQIAVVWCVLSALALLAFVGLTSPGRRSDRAAQDRREG